MAVGRVLRLGAEDKLKKVGGVKSRTKDELSKLLIEGKVNVKEMTEEEIALVIDIASEYQARAAFLAAMVKNAKSTVMAHAKENSWKTKATKNAVATVKKGTKTTACSATRMTRLLKDEDRLDLINAVLKVGITDAKKYLGEDALEGVFQKETKDYGSLTITSLTD